MNETNLNAERFSKRVLVAGYLEDIDSKLGTPPQFENNAFGTLILESNQVFYYRTTINKREEVKDMKKPVIKKRKNVVSGTNAGACTCCGGNAK